MRLSFLIIAVLCLSLDAQKQPNAGVIYGTVLLPDGEPAAGVTLNAMPRDGVPLGMALPWTKTDDAGTYRFERLPLRQYAVYPQDEQAGYSVFTTGMGGEGPSSEVELTFDAPEKKFNFRLPPPAGFVVFHLINRSTGAPISRFVVKVMSTKITPKVIFSGSFGSSEAILVPSDRDLLLHVTSWGFLEWAGSAGIGKPVHLSPGKRLILDVELQPSNPLTQRIADADPKVYQGIRDGKSWRNPYLIIRADEIEVAGATGVKGPISVDDVTQFLEGLPVSAWPYGRVVAVQDSRVVRSEAEEPQIEANRDRLRKQLDDLGVIVNPWPSA